MTKPDTEARVGQDQWLDALDTSTALQVMLASQFGAAAAVEAALAPIAQAVEAMTARLAADDTARIIYAGAGTSIRVAVQDGVELGRHLTGLRNVLAIWLGERGADERGRKRRDDVEAAKRGVEGLQLAHPTS